LPQGGPPLAPGGSSPCPRGVFLGHFLTNSCTHLCTFWCTFVHIRVHICVHLGGVPLHVGTFFPLPQGGSSPCPRGVLRPHIGPGSPPLLGGVFTLPQGGPGGPGHPSQGVCLGHFLTSSCTHLCTFVYTFVYILVHICAHSGYTFVPNWGCTAPHLASFFPLSQGGSSPCPRGVLRPHIGPGSPPCWGGLPLAPGGLKPHIGPGYPPAGGVFALPQGGSRGSRTPLPGGVSGSLFDQFVHTFVHILVHICAHFGYTFVPNLGCTPPPGYILPLAPGGVLRPHIGPGSPPLLGGSSPCPRGVLRPHIGPGSPGLPLAPGGLRPHIGPGSPPLRGVFPLPQGVFLGHFLTHSCTHLCTFWCTFVHILGTHSSPIGGVQPPTWPHSSPCPRGVLPLPQGGPEAAHWPRVTPPAGGVFTLPQGGPGGPPPLWGVRTPLPGRCFGVTF